MIELPSSQCFVLYFKLRTAKQKANSTKLSPTAMRPMTMVLCANVRYWDKIPGINVQVSISTVVVLVVTDYINTSGIMLRDRR